MKNHVINHKKWRSPVGELFLYSSDQSLIGLKFSDSRADLLKHFGPSTWVNKTTEVIESTIRQLKEYFAGSRKIFEIEILPQGTDFQKKAWRALTKIPYGKTISYRDQAKKIKLDKAFRAIGTANGKNPISIIIPCHRVIGSSGKISGYNGGPQIKAKLLEIEEITL